MNTGYAEVTADKVTILVETAERADLIDKERAKIAKENAEAKLAKMSKDDVEFEIIRAALDKGNHKDQCSGKVIRTRIDQTQESQELRNEYLFSLLAFLFL